MKFGFFGINNGFSCFPAASAAIAKAAEEQGFESLWTGEHVVAPDPQVPPSPVAPTFPMTDPGVALAFVAAHTRTIRLGTGIIIMPQRNPLVLAKELASVDVLSEGRLIFGIGVGYLKPEFEALGIPFENRGARTDEYLAAILALWTMEKPEFSGRFINFKGINAMPRPVQKPHPPVVVGGHSPEAYARAARLGSGWYGFALDLDAAKASIEGLRLACEKQGRAFSEIEISVTPPRSAKADRDMAKRYAELGVHRLILLPSARDETGTLKQIAEVGRDWVGKI